MKTDVYRKTQDEKIIADSQSLLTNALSNNPNKEEFEFYISQSKERVFGNRFLETNIYGYMYPRTPRRLAADGVLTIMEEEVKLPLEKVDIDKIWGETLTEGTDVLNDSDYYEGRVVKATAFAGNKRRGLKGLKKVKVIRGTALSWLNKHGYYINNPEKLFGFRGKQYFIKTVDGTEVTVDFSETLKNKKVMAGYYLLFALDLLLRKNYIRDGSWIRVEVSQSEISETIHGAFPDYQRVDEAWIKDTRSNLLKYKITTVMQEILNISTFNRPTQKYTFSIKLP